MVYLFVTYASPSMLSTVIYAFSYTDLHYYFVFFAWFVPFIRLMNFLSRYLYDLYFFFFFFFITLFIFCSVHIFQRNEFFYHEIVRNFLQSDDLFVDQKMFGDKNLISLLEKFRMLRKR